MATWDGSNIPEFEPSNQYNHSNQTRDIKQESSSPNYPNNARLTYFQDNSIYNNGSMIFQPSTGQGRNYQPNQKTDKFSRNKTQSNPDYSNQNSSINNDRQYFYEDNKYFQNSRYPPYNMTSHRSGDIVDYIPPPSSSSSSLAENSNLQATASEFIPSQNTSYSNQYDSNKVKPIRDNRRIKYHTNSNYNGINNSNKETYGMKQYNNRRENKWSENVTNEYSDSTHDVESNSSFRKYQNKYDNNQFYQKNLQVRQMKRDVKNNLPHEKVDNTNLPNEISSNNSYNDNISNLSEDHSLKSNRNARYYQDGRDQFYERNMNFGSRERRINSSNSYNSDRNNYKYRSGREERSVENERESNNWRERDIKSTDKNTEVRKYFNKIKLDDDANQRERLSEQLNRGKLECLVCCEYIRQTDYIWSCQNCFHVLHLKCIKKWAMSSLEDKGWFCPACRNVTTDIPENYKCFCGKVTMPDWNRRDTAHSCGEICGRIKSNIHCNHKCVIQCHPGSCPPCNVMVHKSCGCGKITQMQKCSVQKLLFCEEKCGKLLNCEAHQCGKQCHHGSCESCGKILIQECYCGKNKQEKVCIKNFEQKYSCDNKCDKYLDCKNHKCFEICHEGPCKPCALKPETVTSCCCGKTPISIQRGSCLDPVPVCDQTCEKSLKCGQPSNPHTCQAKCHTDDCPDCGLTTKVKCRCGHMDKEILCTELKSKADDARCEKKCTKKRSCGKHKCNRMCCIDIEHICPLPCSKTLNCGIHKCEQTCHKGRCQPCWRSSFDELYCECGTAVIYPPVPCGTKKPVCNKPCTRNHPCEHEVLHNCHSEPNCPPCTVLTKKWCYGKHELRKAVPCYQNEISCGLPCNKPLSCSRHKCILLCHTGPCQKPGEICSQPCTIPRETCGHICGMPCHDDKCVESPCKEMVKVTCECGNRTMKRICAENAQDYKRIVSGILANKMSEVQMGHTVDLDEVFGKAKKQNQLKTLECNEECKLIIRNQRLALGLQIVNPDLSSKLTPNYSEFMKQWGKKDPAFCQMVHEKLNELVQLAKTSKQKSRSYSFPCMNREKRQFVHESCEHFGCESQAYDEEPNRNVVATAIKDKCWLPSYSLLELIRRETGQRKVPGPVMNKSKLTQSGVSLTSLRRVPKD